MRKTFEDLHPNHKMAFVDGLFTAAVIAGFAWWAQRATIVPEKTYSHDEYTTASSYMYQSGLDDEHIRLIPFVDREAYEKHYNKPYLPTR